MAILQDPTPAPTRSIRGAAILAACVAAIGGGAAALDHATSGPAPAARVSSVVPYTGPDPVSAKHLQVDAARATAPDPLIAKSAMGLGAQ